MLTELGVRSISKTPKDQAVQAPTQPIHRFTKYCPMNHPQIDNRKAFTCTHYPALNEWGSTLMVQAADSRSQLHVPSGHPAQNMLLKVILVCRVFASRFGKLPQTSDSEQVQKNVSTLACLGMLLLAPAQTSRARCLHVHVAISLVHNRRISIAFRSQETCHDAVRGWECPNIAGRSWHKRS